MSSSRAEAASSFTESSRLRAISGTRTLSSNCPWVPATLIAASLPITWSPTWITTSQITGLTLPGMIDDPFCSSGRRISARPARGPEPISARSLAILIIETATTFNAPDSSTRASRLPWASNGSAGALDLETGLLGQEPAHPAGELGMGVEAGARGGAAERDLADPRQRPADPVGAEPDLSREAGELLPEGDRHGVHQVGAARLHMPRELVGLRRKGVGERVERGQQTGGDLAERGQVDRRREDVV